MQRLEVSAVRPIYGSLGVKRLISLNHILRYFYGGEPQTFLFTSKEFQAARVWKPLMCPV